ncbi:MAG: hypothetical protein ACJ8C4_14160 [Gemmataceae bacterium]
MAKAEGTGNPYRCWERFVQRHPGHRCLKSDVIYSLTEPIIDAVQSLVPRFLSKDDEQFERDLARTVSFGFFCQRAFGAVGSESETTTDLTARQAKLSAEIDAMLHTEYEDAGRQPEDVEAYFTATSKRRTDIEARKSAYIGWLATNSGFWTEVAELKSAWQSKIQELRRFPRIPLWAGFDLDHEHSFPNQLLDEFRAFYQRWGLFQLLTWEWPIPLDADLVGGVFHDIKALSESGVTLFVPWYLLRGEKLNVSEVIHQLRSLEVPPHLRGWFQKSKSDEDGLGERRFEKVAALYRFMFLALRRRYPDSYCNRKQEVDAAFSIALDGRPLGEQSITRLRRELQKTHD